MIPKNNLDYVKSYAKALKKKSAVFQTAENVDRNPVKIKQAGFQE